MQNISFTNSIYWQYRYLHFPQMWENDIETVVHHNFKTISFKFHRFSCDILFYSEQISHTVFLMLFYFTVSRFLTQFFSTWDMTEQIVHWWLHQNLLLLLHSLMEISLLHFKIGKIVHMLLFIVLSFVLYFWNTETWHIFSENRIGGVIVSMLAASVIYRGFAPRLCQAKDYEIGICCFSARSIKEKELVGSESEYCVRVERHVYPWTFVSVS
jgi:hypothetical protein